MSETGGRYIEVIGDGSYFEKVSAYIVELNFEVRAAREDDGMKEIETLKNDCLDRLIQAGIDRTLIVDKGGEIWPPLSHGKRISRDAFYKLIIKTPKIEALSQAVTEFEASLTNLRHSLDVDMSRTVYSNDLKPELIAQKRALDNARIKAAAVAKATGVKLGGVIRIEELEKIRRDPEASADSEPDPNWLDKTDAAPFMAEMETRSARTALTPTPRQNILIKYRARFELAPA